MMIFALCLIMGIIGAIDALGQTATVRTRLQDVALGKLQDVKRDVPDLLAEYPNDPGVHFLHAVVLDDADKAVPIYTRIVNEHGTSEWADDAQWRIVQYYALKRDTSRARRELYRYRTNYPQSEFLLAAMETVRATVGLGTQQQISNAADSKPQAALKSQQSAVATQKPQTTNTNKTAPQSLKPDTYPAEESPKKTEEPPKKVEEPIKPVKYSLQVGSYATRETAEEMVEEFRKKRLRAALLQKNVGNEKVFAVIIGEYPNRESAERAKEIVQRQCECEPFVVEK
ncbi:MAG: SPOR domain-containing protein [Candidatus Kapaibacterium sp.]|jgi:cell division septation protein DedD|nr:SPOR domain-containing protein [Candidatus Kapabacteria bacterium]